MRRVGGMCRDDCAISLFRHDEPEKVFTSLKVSVCKRLCWVERRVRLTVGVLIDDSGLCVRPMHRQKPRPATTSNRYLVPASTSRQIFL